KRHHEFVRTLEGVVDIFCTKHFAAQFEATVEHVAHRFSVIFAHFLLHLVKGKVRNNITSRSQLPRKHHGGLVWWRASQRRKRCLNALAHAASTCRSTMTGSVKVKVEPWPGCDSTQIFPPCISMMRLEIARPRPVPPFLRVIALSAC